MKPNSTNKGFTLIELLVVIAIIGLLSSVILVSISSARTNARDTAKVQNLNELAKALEIYSIDHTNCPSIGTGSESANGYTSTASVNGYFDPDLGFVYTAGWTDPHGSEFATKLAPYLSTLPVTSNPSNGNLYEYSYGWTASNWFGTNIPGPGAFCLRQPAGSCLAFVYLENPKNVPSTSLLSWIPNNVTYVIPIGSYTFQKSACT